MNQNTIAIICDCDETLAPDTTGFLLDYNGLSQKLFWENVSKMVSQGWDPPLAYMNEIVELMKSCHIEQDTNEKLTALGEHVKPYKGVPEFIPELKSMIKQNKDFTKAGISLECYIISSGMEDLIKGSVLSKYFDDIFAGRFAIDMHGSIVGIKSSVTFTEKTKFLYAINKGISGTDLRKKPYLVNNAIKRVDRRIPFEYMIYLGDGPSDIPCFSAVRDYGGNCIGIVGKDSAHKGYELARGKRTTVGPYSRNYEKGSDLRMMLETIINKIGYQIVTKKKESGLN
ncbi:HAD family hydrolase [Candidatus Nitrosotalea okcheonensis]|uniref:Haloacid dehalogenase-like hydrolase n=1 Tax=Candidatus Nitrosotalea okcheonensis TaxID=1903276 RepID=A0A2H1FFY5_9ARCH|nr:HAD family hydrolase [Candidatus Nitrosotalea okcheonensis]SMH71667.1 conserved protein of unknown function [Candidatus Nitrosotalea okcheonensis]